MENLKRANRVSIKAYGDGIYTADFYKTHTKVASIESVETGFEADPTATKTATREAFRRYVCDHAMCFGIDFDPMDRREENNKRRPTYSTPADLIEDAISMIADDVARFISKMPNADMVTDHTISIEALIPKIATSNGNSLERLGIVDGRYANGNLAWFDLDGTVAIDVVHDGQVDTIYQAIGLELVSGQLKKFRMSQTQWNRDMKISFEEIGIVEPPKETTKKGTERNEEEQEEQKDTESKENEEKAKKTTRKTTKKRTTKKTKEESQGIQG